MSIFRHYAKFTALLGTVLLCMVLVTTGCSDSDRPKSDSSAGKSVLKVIMGVAQEGAKASDLPQEVAKLSLSLFDGQGQRLDEAYDYTATGTGDDYKWLEPSPGTRVLALVVPETRVDVIERLAVETYNADGDFLGLYTIGGVQIIEGGVTPVDFTKGDAPAFTPLEQCVDKLTLERTTSPALVKESVTVDVQEQITVSISLVYTDAQGVSFVNLVPAANIDLDANDDPAVSIYGNVITAKNATPGTVVKVAVTVGTTKISAEPITVVVNGSGTNSMLQVVVGLEGETSNGYDVPSGTTQLNIVLFDEQAMQIGSYFAFTASGEDGKGKWQELGPNELLLAVEMPEDYVSRVDRIEVDSHQDGDFLGGVNASNVKMATNATTRVDFTEPGAQAFVDGDTYDQNRIFVCSSEPEMTESVVKIGVNETATIHMWQVYTDPTGVKYIFYINDQRVCLKSESDALATEGNVITGKSAVTEAPVTAYAVFVGSPYNATFKVTVTE